jgi:GntR family transcriptional regulator, transcriptional repressor for pyruvate dehydrogenase complex
MSDTGGYALKRLERSEAISVTVAGELLNYLLSGQLPVGARLPSERDLAELLGVGRSAVREALKPLALLGVVEVRQGSGTYFRGTASELLPRVIEWSLLLGDRSISELAEARTTVERTIARLAAIHRDERQLAELRSVIDTMSKRDMHTFADADRQFHICLSEASQNRVLAGILSSIRELQRAWFASINKKSDLDVLFELHRQIFLAIEAQDPDAAEEAMRVHMEWVTERLFAISASRGGDEKVYLS